MSNNTKVIITGEDRTKAAFGSINRQMGDLKNNAAALSRGFGALFGAISVGGLAMFAKSGVDAADALNDMSQRTGVAVKTLAEYKLAATLADTSLDDLAKGIQRLTLAQGQAEQGGKAQAEALKRLGISAKDPQLAFEQLADAVAKSNDPTKLAVDLNALLGRSYVNLLPLLQGGSQALRDSADASASFAESMVNLAPDAAKLNDELDLMKVNAAGAAGALLSKLVPALNDVFERIGLVKQLIGAGGLFNTLVNTAGTDDIGEVMRRVRGEIELTQRAIDGERARGKDASPFEEKLRGLNAQLQILIANRVKAQMVPPPSSQPRQASSGGVVELSGSDPAAAAAAKAAASAAARDRKAAAAAALALRAEESTQAARLEQDDLARQIDANKAAFDAKLIDAADYYAALTELQRQQAASEIAALQTQRAAAAAVRGSDADRLKARADIVKIDAEIELIERRTADQAVANAASRIAVADALNLKQADFLDALEQEAFLAGLSNDERETALLLLEAEKLGISDVNRLLELQGQIRAANAEKDAAKETQRQQDDLYASVQQGVQKAFADGLNAIATGEGGIRGALQGVVDMLRNALGNAIAGSLTESFMGMLGGKDGVLNIAGMFGFGSSKEGEDGAGGLFGIGGKKGETPTNPLYVKDVAATGGIDSLLGGGEGEDGGGMFGGIGDIFTNMFSGIGNMLSGLFSNLMSGLGSLMSGLGGGLSSMMSGLGGIFGFADGGFTGAGGKYQPAGVVHAGEYVFSADSVRRLGLGALDNLHRIARGSMIPRGPRLGYAEGGLVNLPGSAAPSVTSNTKVVNMFDLDSALAEYLNTRGGERAILNVIQRNPGAASA